MNNRFVIAFAASSLVAFGLLAPPAAAQDTDYPPPPPPDDQQDPTQLPPEVEYGRPVEAPPPPVAQQCAPCDQRQPPPPVAHNGFLLMGFVGMNVFAGKGILDDSAAGLSLSLGPGLRLGGLVGFHLTPWISAKASSPSTS